MAMDAELLVECTIRKVRLPVWVERVGVLPDFDVAPDFGFARVHQAQPNRFAVRSLLPRLGRKRPSSIA
jgi:hypothetical protein